MSVDDDGGPAFPLPMGAETSTGSEGMALRDYFAAKAMQELLNGEYQFMHQIAYDSYQMADAMLKERGRTNTKENMND